MGSRRKLSATPPAAATTAAAAAATTADPRWPAVQRRDASADGRFFYAVKTTGVYCRPSCAARPARPENLAFFDDRAAAERAGFRACLRCKPDQPPADQRRAALVAELCRHIEATLEATPDAPPSLDELAAHAGLSPFYAHRLFKAATGLTPKAYAAAHRRQRLGRALDDRPSVTDALYDAGFNSSARFYEQSTQLLGMTPTQYRNGAVRLAIRFAIAECSLGALLVAATDRGVCAILLGDDPEALAHELEHRFPRAQLLGADAEFEQLVARIIALVEAPAAATAELPLDIRGTAFQQRVWRALTRIPAGTTATYAQIAAAIGAPRSTRAVAAACAANALAVAIPCHRVVRSDGNLSGYRWGVERKRALLDREAGAPTAAARR